jgi:glutamate synthase domain-containing protein 3
VLKEQILAAVDPKLVDRVRVEAEVWKIDAEGMVYKDLNSLLRAISSSGAERIEIRNVCGQRYIGTDLDKDVQIDIYGTPGNDLGAFMNGPRVVVHGNAQDGCGNTMNEGQIIVHGHAGDITGHSMRGGRVFVRDDVGYRVGIHMKEFEGKKPQLVIGGTGQDFLGEYMAGGVILVLGLTLPEGERCNARFVGTGMHGGVIYERGDLFELGEGTKVMNVGKRDTRVIESLTRDFCSYFGFKFEKIMTAKFRKIMPVSKRPYGKLYSH